MDIGEAVETIGEMFARSVRHGYNPRPHSAAEIRRDVESLLAEISQDELPSLRDALVETIKAARVATGEGTCAIEQDARDEAFPGFADGWQEHEIDFLRVFFERKGVSFPITPMESGDYVATIREIFGRREPTINERDGESDVSEETSANEFVMEWIAPVLGQAPLADRTMIVHMVIDEGGLAPEEQNALQTLLRRLSK